MAVNSKTAMVILQILKMVHDCTIIKGGRTFQKLHHLWGGGGVTKTLLQREDNFEKGRR